VYVYVDMCTRVCVSAGKYKEGRSKVQARGRRKVEVMLCDVCCVLCGVFVWWWWWLGAVHVSDDPCLPQRSLHFPTRGSIFSKCSRQRLKTALMNSLVSGGSG
jgi:hypothetical protein